MPGFRLLDLVVYFLKLGATGFGGPIALVGYMQKDLVEDRKWFSKEDYLEGLALAGLAPGPLAAQLAIYFGYLKAKILGATLIGIAFIFAPFLIVWVLSYLYVAYKGLPWVSGLFYGMSAAVIGIIIPSAYRLTKLTLDKKKGLYFIFSILAITTAVTQRESILLFVSGGALAILFYALPKNWFQSPKFFSFLPFEMFFFFAKAGACVFGSGLAIIPFLYGDVVEGYRWLTDQQFLDAVAVGMITPGPILISVGFIGYLVAKFPGSLVSVVGVFLPVYLFVILFVPWFRKIRKNQQVNAFVSGVTAAAIGAIAGAAWILARKAIVDGPTLVLALAVLLLVAKTKIPHPFLIVGASLIGLGLQMT